MLLCLFLSLLACAFLLPLPLSVCACVCSFVCREYFWKYLCWTEKPSNNFNWRNEWKRNRVCFYRDCSLFTRFQVSTRISADYCQCIRPILRSNNRPPQQQLLRTCERIVTTYLNGEVLPHKTLYSYNLFTNTNTIAQKMGKHVYVHRIQHRYTGERLSLNSAQSIESIAEFDISVKCFTEAHILWKIEQMQKSKLRQRVHKFEPDLYAFVILLSHFNGFLLRKHFAFDFSAHCCCCCCSWLWKIHTWKRAQLTPIHTSTTALHHHYIFIIKIWKICAFAYNWALFFWLCICKWLCDLYIVVPLCFYSKFFKLAIIVEEHGKKNKQTKQEHTRSFWNSIILLNAKSSQFEVPAVIYVNFMRNMYGRVRTRFAKK